jgi:hypothetical protein
MSIGALLMKQLKLQKFVQRKWRHDLVDLSIFHKSRKNLNCKDK